MLFIFAPFGHPHRHSVLCNFGYATGKWGLDYGNNLYVSFSYFSDLLSGIRAVTDPEGAANIGYREEIPFLFPDGPTQPVLRVYPNFSQHFDLDLQAACTLWSYKAVNRRPGAKALSYEQLLQFSPQTTRQQLIDYADSIPNLQAYLATPGARQLDREPYIAGSPPNEVHRGPLRRSGAYQELISLQFEINQLRQRVRYVRYDPEQLTGKPPGLRPNDYEVRVFNLENDLLNAACAITDLIFAHCPESDPLRDAHPELLHYTSSEEPVVHSPPAAGTSAQPVDDSAGTAGQEKKLRHD